MAEQPHNDLPTLDDKLEWKDELDRLSQRIQSCDTPHVMGIHGDWGSGKTSFMRQLQSRLGGEMPDDASVSHREKCMPPAERKKLQKKIITIWFDAWRYQNEPAPVVALLHEMRRQMAVLPAVKEKFKKLGEISLRYTLNSLADVGKAIGFEGMPSADKIEKLGESWEKEHYAQALTSDTVRNHLHATIKSLLPEKEARVVVFIDDLDRCNSKAAIRLLEGLKIYLSVPDCVFVLGMNERILVDAIREEISAPKETTPEELKLRAAHYLEKICTDIYRLPLPKDPTLFFTNWIDDAEQRQALIAAINTTICLPPNPRRLKALANQWPRFSRCVAFPADADKRPIWAVRVLVAAYVHQFHRDLWERWHFNSNFWAEFTAWCSGESTQNIPKWAEALRWTEQITDGEWASNFPNPGDIDIFWMNSLIRVYSDQLRPKDFELLLRSKQQDIPTAP